MNSDLYDKAKAVGLNASQLAEEALAAALARKIAETVRSEMREDLAAYNAYVDKHGSPADLVRAHYGKREPD